MQTRRQFRLPVLTKGGPPIELPSLRGTRVPAESLLMTHPGKRSVSQFLHHSWQLFCHWNKKKMKSCSQGPFVRDKRSCSPLTSDTRTLVRHPPVWLRQGWLNWELSTDFSRSLNIGSTLRKYTYSCLKVAMTLLISIESWICTHLLIYTSFGKW